MLPDKYHLKIPNLDDNNEQPRRMENMREIDRVVNAIPFGANTRTLAPTQCAGNSNPTGFLDYDYATAAVANTRFRLLHRKMRPETNVIVHGFLSAYVDSSIGVAIYVQVDAGSNYLVGRRDFNETLSHKQIVLNGSIPSVPPGLHSYKLQWVVSGGPTVFTNTDDWAGFSVSEHYEEPVT